MVRTAASRGNKSHNDSADGVGRTTRKCPLNHFGQAHPGASIPQAPKAQPKAGDDFERGCWPLHPVHAAGPAPLCFPWGSGSTGGCDGGCVGWVCCGAGGAREVRASPLPCPTPCACGQMSAPAPRVVLVMKGAHTETPLQVCVGMSPV
jgi:hypothetical protein